MRKDRHSQAHLNAVLGLWNQSPKGDLYSSLGCIQKKRHVGGMLASVFTSGFEGMIDPYIRDVWMN